MAFVAVNAQQFPEENLLSTALSGGGFFITRPGALLKDGRYKVVRKLGKGRCSSTFLVEDLECSMQYRKYLAAKILSVNSTNALRNGLSCELEILQTVADRLKDARPLDLPVLLDHFAQEGPHGVHFCILTSPLSPDVHAFQATAPTGRLAVHIVKPMIASVVDALQLLHSCNIIHADINSDNVHFLAPDTAEIEEILPANPPLVDGTFQFNGEQYPILLSQPFLPPIPWDVTPFNAETIVVNLSDLGSALWADKPNPPGDIGAFALRAPENIVRAACDKKIDIWAIGCMTYELLTGQILFQPQPVTGLTPDERLLLLQYALTGETLTKDVVEQSLAKEKYFDQEGVFIKSKSNPYSRQTFKELLTKYCRGSDPELNEIQIDAAAKFIGDCLRLNPQDRLDAAELAMHDWLESAFMGGWDK